MRNSTKKDPAKMFGISPLLLLLAFIVARGFPPFSFSFFSNGDRF